jgi:GST-like protein
MSCGYVLYGAGGGGSMIVEAAFAIANVPVAFEDLQWSEVGWSSPRLKDLNPLGQVPTLVMPDGQVMTESAAMILHLNDVAPQASLAPLPDHPKRAAFLRWLIFLVSAVYPTFTYGDEPNRWLDGDEEAGAKLRRGTDEHRKMLWRHLETHVSAPWFLGETWSALDLYMPPMTYWRPGRDWFQAECPKLHEIAQKMQAHPAFTAVLARNGVAGA